MTLTAVMSLSGLALPPLRLERLRAMSPAPAAPQLANVSAAKQLNDDVENGSAINGNDGILGVSTEKAAQPSDSLGQRLWKKLDGEVDTTQARPCQAVSHVEVC